MDIITRRIANLLNENPKSLIVVKESDDQYVITTKNLKNYIYSESEDTLIDFDSLSNKDKTSEKFLTEEEKEAYYKENQGLIGFSLRKINRIDGIEAEELKDVCILGFAKALSNFNKNAGIKFSTYCVRCMLNELYYYLRKEQKKLMKNMSFDKELTNDKDGSSVHVGDLIDSRINGGKSIEDNTLGKELRTILLRCLSELEEDEQFLISYRYGINDENIILTQNIIAEKLHMSQANISKLEKTCLKKLRMLMKQQHYIYDTKSKVLEINLDPVFDLGADEKYNYLGKDSNDNIMLIAADRLRLDIDEISEISKTDNRNEFIVKFKRNNRLYAVVNNITTFVEVKKRELSKDERFMELVLHIPTLYIPTRDDVETEKYHIQYDKKKLKKELDKLSETERFVISSIYGIQNTKQLLTHSIAEKLNLTIDEVYKIRKTAMNKLEKAFS